MVRDDRKLVVIQGATTKPVVRIFTAAGEALAAFVWDHGRIVGMGWSNQEDLLIIEDKGEVRMRLCPAHADQYRECVGSSAWLIWCRASTFISVMRLHSDFITHLAT